MLEDNWTGSLLISTFLIHPMNGVLETTPLTLANNLCPPKNRALAVSVDVEWDGPIRGSVNTLSTDNVTTFFDLTAEIKINLCHKRLANKKLLLFLCSALVK